MASLSEVEAILVTAAIASLLAGWGVITQRLVARRLKTIEHLSHQEADRDMIEARATFNRLSAADGKLSGYVTPDDLTKDETDKVRLVLNDYELIAIGIQYSTLDFGIYRQFARGRTLRDWARAAPFIYKLRNELGNQLVYYEFEDLAHRLQSNRRPRRRSWLRLIL